jgi:putative hydrolases of HD superfamily
MRKLIDFFTLAGRLKRIKRRGVMLYGKSEEDAESTAEHVCRMALMAWVLGARKDGLDLARVIKLALVHDLCGVFAGDVTPYDGLLPRDKKEQYEFVRTWPGLSRADREKRFQKRHGREKRGLERLVSRLDGPLAKDMMDLWLDYESSTSKEAKFVRQVDRLENLLQAEEYYEEDGVFPTKPWWMHAEESVDDPLILELMKVLENREMGVRSERGDLKV